MSTSYSSSNTFLLSLKLSPFLSHLSASSPLSMRSNNIYLEATGPKKAVEGAPEELVIVAN